MNNLNSERSFGIAGLYRNTLLHAVALLFVALFWPIASAHAAAYSFSLFGSMTATNSNGDTIHVTGGGAFDTTGLGVEAHGSYSVTNTAGEVIRHGTWAATDFVSFDSDGGPNKGLQGGDLVLTVTLFPHDGPPESGVTLTLTCPFENGVFDNPSCDITVGEFLNPEGGVMAFHLIKP